MSDTIKTGDLTKEEYREYKFPDGMGGKTTHRITSPKTLYQREGGTTHRVLDADGLVHLLPAPGTKGCVLTWKPKDASDPVQF